MGKNLETLSALVSEHRREKGRVPYPGSIWESVSILRKQYTVEAICRATGICPSLIYKRTRAQKPNQSTMFREVKLVPPTAAIKPVVVEVRRCDGAELRFKIEANTGELSGLFLEFLR